MISFLLASLISIVLVTVSVVIFYEILAKAWLVLSRWEGHPRRQILLTILSAFLAHTIAVWIFGIAYYVLAHHAGFGALRGPDDDVFLNYIYFSAVTYSSLGLGDVYPQGSLRMLIGVEAILGLILIGWTITYTYLFTDKYMTHRLKQRGQPKD